MKISVLGTGIVGQTIASKMIDLGHEVFMGTRDANETKSRTDVNPSTERSFKAWHEQNAAIEVLNYEDLPADTSIFVNATGGGVSIKVLESVGEEKLSNKTILDIANPLDFSNGMPPSLFVSNTDSLAENIQAKFPKSKVVKSLNTMSSYLMVNPALVAGDHTVFISGNDSDAKNQVRELLEKIGWKSKNILDIGDISTARGTEMLLPIWLRLWGALGTAEFNFHIVKNETN